MTPCGASPRIPNASAIGEAGLDYHYNYAPPEVAKRVFRGQIALARELALPLVIHTREAEDDTAAILKDEMGQGAFAALLHCFTSSRALAETALDLGLSISFSGVVTFKKSEELRAVARNVPLDRILVETDAPYLAPVPHRGRRNEPAYVAATATAVAEAKGIRARSARGGDARQHAAAFPEARPGRLPALSLRLTILGCGSSAGVPRVAQGWGACDPANPRNRRRRCSALVERIGYARRGETHVSPLTTPVMLVMLPCNQRSGVPALSQISMPSTVHQVSVAAHVTRFDLAVTPAVGAANADDPMPAPPAVYPPNVVSSVPFAVLIGVPFALINRSLNGGALDQR